MIGRLRGILAEMGERQHGDARPATVICHGMVDRRELSVLHWPRRQAADSPAAAR